MKIGIVGSGMISGNHVAAASRWPAAEVVGIVDRDISRARAQAAKHSINRTFDNLPDLLALGPDVVHILTPPDSHATLAMEALRAGAHVFVEKPMAMSEQECIAMAAAAVRAGRAVVVGHCWRFVPSLLQARGLVWSGHQR